MTRIRSVAVIGILAGALTAGSALAQSPDGGPGRGPRGGGFGRGGEVGRGGLELRGLALTDAQRQQIRALHEQHREQTQAAAARLRSAMDAQRKAVETMPVDESAIRATSQELVDAQTELAIQRAKLHAGVFALLTPEQQAQAAKLRAERGGRGGPRGDRGRLR
jgi:protein CpxP